MSDLAGGPSSSVSSGRFGTGLRAEMEVQAQPSAGSQQSRIPKNPSPYPTPWLSFPAVSPSTVTVPILALFVLMAVKAGPVQGLSLPGCSSSRNAKIQLLKDREGSRRQREG